MLQAFDWPGADDDAVSSRRKHFKLPNTSLIQPLWHGDGCIGLSGIYSLVNGIRLVLAHKVNLHSRQCDDLLIAGLRFMDGRLTPSRAAMSGLRLNTWKQLAEALTAYARDRHRMLVFAERVHSGDHVIDRASAWRAIEQAIDLFRAVLLLVGGGRYTVVSGYTPSSLLLFDSAGSYWISKRATGVPGDCDGARYIIYPSSFLTLRA